MATKIIDYANGELIIDGKRVKRVSELGASGGAPQILAAESAGGGQNFTPGFSNQQNVSLEYYDDPVTDAGTGEPGGGQQQASAQGGGNEQEGGAQHAENQADAAFSGGMIDDFDNWSKAVRVGSAPVGQYGMVGLAGTLAQDIDAFTRDYGNWNSLPGFEAKARQYAQQENISPTEAMRKAREDYIRNGQYPESYVAPVEDVAEAVAAEEAGAVDKGGGGGFSASSADYSKALDKPTPGTEADAFGFNGTEAQVNAMNAQDAARVNQPGGGGGLGGNNPGGSSAGNNSTSTGAKAQDRDGSPGDRGGGRAGGGGNNSSSSGAKAQDRDFASGGFVTKPPMPYKNGGYVESEYMMPKSSVPEPVPAKPFASDPRDSFAQGGFVPNAGYKGGGFVNNRPGYTDGSGYTPIRKDRFTPAELTEMVNAQAAQGAKGRDATGGRNRGGADPGRGGQPSRGSMGGSGRRAFADGGFVDDPAGDAAMSDRFNPDPAAIADDGVVDNQPINADEGEFVINRDAAQIAGPDLLNALNDPTQAGLLRELYEVMLEMSAGAPAAASPTPAVPAGAPPSAKPALPPAAGASLASFGGGPKPPARPKAPAPFA